MEGKLSINYLWRQWRKYSHDIYWLQRNIKTKDFIEIRIKKVKIPIVSAKMETKTYIGTSHLRQNKNV